MFTWDQERPNRWNGIVYNNKTEYKNIILSIIKWMKNKWKKEKFEYH